MSYAPIRIAHAGVLAFQPDGSMQVAGWFFDLGDRPTDGVDCMSTYRQDILTAVWLHVQAQFAKDLRELTDSRIDLSIELEAQEVTNALMQKMRKP